MFTMYSKNTLSRLALALIALLSLQAGTLQAAGGIPRDGPNEASVEGADQDMEPIVTKGGAMYTIWGRTECPNNGTDEVYVGVVGGQEHQHTGGGSNYLCLPLDPQWSNHNDAVNGAASIYGAEYQTAKFPFDGISTNGVEGLLNQNVPCAVCRSKRAVSVMMLPARKECYIGWNLEYHGYLMSEYHSHKGRTEYVCVDAEPEADPAGYRDENGVLFYSVEGSCGSLPCPPYVNGRELTCAVCTK